MARAITAGLCLAYVAAETLPPLLGPAMSFLTRTASPLPAPTLAKLPSVLSAGSVAGGLLGGSLFEEAAGVWRSSLVLFAALLVTALANALVPGSPTSMRMFACMGVLGVFNGVFRAGANCVVLRVHHGGAAAPWVQALHLFGGAGRVLAPLLLGLFVDGSGDIDAGLRRAYLTVSSLPVLAGVLLLFLSCGADTREEDGIHPRGEKSGLQHEQQAKKGASPPSTYNRSGLILCGMLLLLFTGCQSTFQNFISSYVTNVGFSPQDSVVVAGVFGSCFTLGRVIAVPLATRWSPLQMMQVDAIGVATALFVLAARPESRQAVWIGTGLFGLSMASLFPSTLNFAKQSMEASGQAITLIMQAASAGAIFIPLLMDSMGGDESLIKCLGLLVAIALGLLLLVLPGILQGKEKQRKSD
jgi:MFS transporter, FHS family, Na+ dependent glucose transporter 1